MNSFDNWNNQQSKQPSGLSYFQKWQNYTRISIERKGDRENYFKCTCCNYAFSLKTWKRNLVEWKFRGRIYIFIRGGWETLSPPIHPGQKDRGEGGVMLFARNPIIRRKDRRRRRWRSSRLDQGCKARGKRGGDGSCRRRYIISHFNDNVYTRAYK